MRREGAGQKVKAWHGHRTAQVRTGGDWTGLDTNMGTGFDTGLGMGPDLRLGAGLDRTGHGERA
eukprot:12015600-Alexandrium_andersonii.AAC.1